MPEPHDLQPDNMDNNNTDDEIPADELRYAPATPSEPNESSDYDEMVSDATDVEEETEAEDDHRTFEDLTLAELVGQLWQSPSRTWRAFTNITSAPRESRHTTSVPIPVPSRQRLPSRQQAITSTASISPDAGVQGSELRFKLQLTRQHVQLGLYILAVIVGLLGSRLLLGPENVKRSEENALMVGAPYLWIAFFIWLGAELFGHWHSLVDWWNRSNRLTQVRWVLRTIPVFVWLTALLRITDSMTAPAELALGLVQVALGRIALGVVLWILIELGVWVIRRIGQNNPQAVSNWTNADSFEAVTNPYPEPLLPNWQHITFTRVMLLITAIASSIVVWIGTPNNTISPPVIAVWFLSAGLWAFTFAPLHWSIFDWATQKLDAVRRFSWHDHWGFILAFVLVMVLGFGFRFYQLDSLPQEMTSDHVEKILDANRVYNGEFNIFFANNGGREPIQMYLMSLFTNLPGLDFNHFTLKLLAAIQSMITLPILVWLGIELIGKDRRKFGIVVGLLLAGLVAVSYWHVAITRQALRIVMTPIFTSLLLIYLARAMRYNRRADFVKTALILGFGLYAYQAVRMLPVVVVAGVTIAILVRQISWRERLVYFVNLSVLVFVSFMVFLPMWHYSTDDPGHFWRRTAGRLLGDDVILEQRPDGTIVERRATTEEQIDAFNANVPILMTNVRNALLMFNWKGDVGWISGVPNDPAMDTYTGTFLILGLAGWGVLMIRSRDPVLWLIPVMIFIMLLPSALSIAYPLENPSHTRTSGTIPPAYLVAALPMAMIAFRFVQVFSKRLGMMIAVVFCGAIIIFANQENTSLYFDVYPPIYLESSYPYSEAGQILRGFAESDGGYGNAFMIAYPHWWGHRAIGIAGGEPWWPNGIVSLDQVPRFMRDAQFREEKFRLDPNKDILFFFSPDDEATSLQLKSWFPEGREQEVQSFHPDDRYMLYRVPFLGDANLSQFLADNQ